MSNIIEKGDIYFFYRNKIEITRAENLDDVQRLYLVTVSDESDDKGRMFVVGKKRMPKMNGQESGAQEWMMNVMTGKPKMIGEELAPKEYETETRGDRRITAAFPVGEGRYALVEHEDHTALAYRLVHPQKPGKAQKEMHLRPEAVYLISVRNPELHVQGFPDEKPGYPESLKKLFADKRWIDISKPALLDYENAQFVLIGAHESLGDIDLKIPGEPDLFKTLGLEKNKWPTEALFEGNFSETQEALAAREPAADPTKGGHKGGKAAVDAPSSAGIARALKGITLPRKKRGLIDYAMNQGAGEEIMETLKALPDRKFETMADVEKALGEVR